jgi:F-type H+-transporting ATPase subunit delta
MRRNLPRRGLLRRQKAHARRAWLGVRRPGPRPLGHCPQSGARSSAGPISKEETRVTDRTSSVSGVAERYASALFDLARDSASIEKVEDELRTMAAAVEESEELRRLVQSPVFSADEQERAIGAVAEHLRIAGLTANFLRLVAKNRRLWALSHMIRALRRLAATHRGEVAAEVVSAHPLKNEQVAALKAALKEKIGKDVTLETRTNPALLGGLVVKVGSRMIDTSLRTRLLTVKTRLKEVG